MPTIARATTSARSRRSSGPTSSAAATRRGSAPDRSPGYAGVRRGARAGAPPPLERAHELCRSNEARLLAPIAAGFLGGVLLDAGDVEAALPILKEAVESAAGIHLMLYHPTR